MRKVGLYSLFLMIGIATTNCSSGNGATNGSGTSSYVAPTQAYTISQANGIGVDDSGQMWIEIDGNFAVSGNTVSVSCDGNVLYSNVQSESATSVVISIPAASFYTDCTFVVQSGGEVSAPFDSFITAMSLSGISHEVLGSSASLVDVEIDGNFTDEPITKSKISVLTSCDGGNTYFSPDIISQKDGAIVVSLTNPGQNKSEQCTFTVQDTFENLENNEEIVTSPSVFGTVTGI